MRPSLLRVLLLSLLFLLSLLPLHTTSSASSAVVINTTVPSSWQAVAPAALEQPHTFIIALPQQNLDVLQQRLSQLSDPTHPTYGQWMSKAELDDLIAPPASVVSTVSEWVQSVGIAASSITHHGDALEVVTTVGHVNALFNTSLHAFEQPGSGRRGVVAHSNISMPAHVAPHVQMLLGVQSFPFAKRHSAVIVPRSHRPTVTSAPSTPSSRFHPMQSYYQFPIMVPRDLAAYYGYPDLTQFGRPAGYRANTSIATVQFDEYDGTTTTYESIKPADIASQGTFADVPGIQSNPGVWGSNHPSTPDTEPSLDIQTVTTNNPLANATHWEENSQSWIYSLCLHLKSQPSPPQVVSISYGTSEQEAYEADNAGGGQLALYLTNTDTQLMALGAMGITVIVSSGDNGANGLAPSSDNNYCSYSSSPYLYASFPASSPHVVAVGATQLNSVTYSSSESNTQWCGLSSAAMPSGYTYSSDFNSYLPFKLVCITSGTEVAVSAAQTGFTSGGGFSRYYAQPSYQAAAVSQYLSSGVAFPPSAYFDTTKRALPDVAMYGESVPVLVNSQVQDVGGTSLSAPLFAAVVAMLNQVSINAGGSTLGYLNPLLYYMAANVSGTFKDITSGDNKLTEACAASSSHSGCSGCQGFTATTGWDAVTGLGSPVYSRMAAYIKQLAQGSSSSSAAAAVSSSARSSSSSTAPPTVASSTAAPTSAPATPTSAVFPASSARATSTPATSAPATSAPATSAPAITSAPATSAQSRPSSSPSSTAPSITSPTPSSPTPTSAVVPSTRASSSSSSAAASTPFTTLVTSLSPASLSPTSSPGSSGPSTSSDSSSTATLLPTSSDDPSSSSSSLSHTAVIAIAVIVAVIALLLCGLLTLALIYCSRRRRLHHPKPQTSSTSQLAASANIDHRGHGEYALPPPSLPARPPSGHTSPRVLPTAWSCPVCTLVQKTTSSRCRACGTKVDPAKRRNDFAQPGGGETEMAPYYR